MVRIGLGALFLSTCLAASAAMAAPQCGGNFATFMQGVKQEAVADGLSARAADRVVDSASIDNKVLTMDRRGQGVFRLTFDEFSKRVISGSRMQNGKARMSQYASVFQRAERQYGVPAPVITAFWALETDFGAVQGDFNTINALATLAHDCRRPEIFRPQLIAAIHMVQNGDLDPATMTGAWAGEIGQVQMLPRDIVKYGVDGDGDGHVSLKTSSADAIMTAAHFIQGLGWHAGEPWLQEVTTPDNFPWEESGIDTHHSVSEWHDMGIDARSGSLPSGSLQASLILPQGRHGPKFLAYPNFNVYLEWNKSFTYTTTAAYFATRLSGAPVFDMSHPDPVLSLAKMKQLQRKLAARGYNVGAIDGILGAGTRDAVRQEQERLGLPADGWPTEELLQSI